VLAETAVFAESAESAETAEFASSGPSGQSSWRHEEMAGEGAGMGWSGMDLSSPFICLKASDFRVLEGHQWSVTNDFSGQMTELSWHVHPVLH
jgi:hypothetical protein